MNASINACRSPSFALLLSACAAASPHPTSLRKRVYRENARRRAALHVGARAIVHGDPVERGLALVRPLSRLRWPFRPNK